MLSVRRALPLAAALGLAATGGLTLSTEGRAALPQGALCATSETVDSARTCRCGSSGSAATTNGGTTALPGFGIGGAAPALPVVSTASRGTSGGAAGPAGHAMPAGAPRGLSTAGGAPESGDQEPQLASASAASQSAGATPQPQQTGIPQENDVPRPIAPRADAPKPPVTPLPQSPSASLPANPPANPPADPPADPPAPVELAGPPAAGDPAAPPDEEQTPATTPPGDPLLDEDDVEEAIEAALPGLPIQDSVNPPAPAAPIVSAPTAVPEPGPLFLLLTLGGLLCGHRLVMRRRT